MKTDRQRVREAGGRKGWSGTVGDDGRELVLRKGDRTITARFDDSGKITSFLAGSHAGRGGVAGILRIMVRIG